MASKSALEELLTYQIRLQGVANDLAQKLQKIIADADAGTLALLKSDYKYVDGDLKKTIISVRKLVDAIKKQRSKSFDSALDLTIETGREVAGTASIETIKETLGLFDSDELANAHAQELEKKAMRDARKAELEERRRRIKPLSDKQIEDVLQYSPIQGESIAQWFYRWQTNDLKRISGAVQTGAVEGLSVAEIVKKILGTKENAYKDGIAQTTRNSATTVARTLINGVSNAARMETLQENDDVLDGIQFLATLDGKTSFICANLDGKIWRGSEMKSAPRPPLHPNCRSTLVPYIELRDAAGNLIDEGADLKDANGNVVVNALTRPAANADFDKLAEEAYNESARAKGSDRRFADLSPSTRQKYYYKAQHDWEEENGGKNAYRQVPVSTTFKEYFEKQPPEFQESWLGRKRYEAYQNGATFDDLTKPDSAFVVSPQNLSAGTTPQSAPPPAPAPQTPSQPAPQEPPKPIENAADFVDFIDAYRREKYGAEEAERMRKESVEFGELKSRTKIVGSQEYLDIVNEIAALVRKQKRSFGDEAINIGKKIQTLRKVKDEKLKEYNLLNSEEKAFRAKRRLTRNSVDVESFFERLFPNRGGNDVFDASSSQKIVDVLDKKGFGDVAQEVLGLYNRIGRGIGFQNAEEITDVEFERMNPTTNGYYKNSSRKIRLQSSLKDEGEVRATFAHEIGHWFENRVFGPDKTTETSEWLSTRTREKFGRISKEGKPIGLGNEPTLCWRDYSHIVRQEWSVPGSPGKTYRCSEVISTAFEGLFDDPETFARQNPEHFNRLLKLLKEVATK